MQAIHAVCAGGAYQSQAPTGPCQAASWYPLPLLPTLAILHMWTHSGGPPEVLLVVHCLHHQLHQQEAAAAPAAAAGGKRHAFGGKGSEADGRRLERA